MPGIEELALCSPRFNEDLPIGYHPELTRCQIEKFLNHASTPKTAEFKYETICRLMPSEGGKFAALWCLPAASTSPKSKSGTPSEIGDHSYVASLRQTKRIRTKYFASLASASMSLYKQHPVSASLLLRRFQPVIWELFLRCMNRQVIISLVNSFEVLHQMWDRTLSERVLARALTASAQTDDALHAKACPSLWLQCSSFHTGRIIVGLSGMHSFATVVVDGNHTHQIHSGLHIPAMKLFTWC